ncbi:MAG: VOC family protein [Pseudonocardiales bacterium]|nr:VOC family protein [Pseudonocardiales bacterium]MBV9727950.1 VOC family protein [Pseudonocardiales bacterium]
MARITERSIRTRPLINITFISHGTLDSVNLQESRRFYEEVFGFEVVQLSKVSLLVRKGGAHTYVVVETGNEDHKMSLMNHNGIDVGSSEEVDRAHEILNTVKEEYRIRQIHPVRHQHGAYSFYLLDLDGNWWEILANRAGGYSYAYDDPGRDLTGRHDLLLSNTDHVMDDETAARVRGTVL